MPEATAETNNVAAYSLGLDFGTASVRALILDLSSGKEAGRGQWAYTHGDGGVVTDPEDPNLARQWPGDYLEGLHAVVAAALEGAHGRGGLQAQEIVSIGVDATGSTPIPVDREGRALTEGGGFANRPAAMAWLWKDHTAGAEAEEITALARRLRPSYLERCGGAYSSEWFWAKILHCLRVAPEVFQAAHSFVELCDFIPAFLAGQRDPERLRRSVCAAGHKAMFAPSWGGLPDAEFLAELAPELAALRERLFDRAYTAAEPAGRLHPEVAKRLGLEPGITIAVGALDAHLGAVGAGIGPGDLVKVIGTSSCDMAVARLETLPGIEGLSGMVRGSILPDHVGFEAGQSAVGDIFAWCATHIGCRGHEELTRDAASLRPGESGLLGLDWHHGNRCLLVDPELSGLLLGLSLSSKDHEIYRAMIEATAFGARAIVERIVAAGVPIDSVIACGGVAQRNPLLLQIYADVLRRPVEVATSSESCALGAAIMGATAAGRFASVEEAQAHLCPPSRGRYTPDPVRADVYDELYAFYMRLHDAFGMAGRRDDLSGIMKGLLGLRARVRR